jgi:DNA (cytosine-5)-methyltransferase 1
MKLLDTFAGIGGFSYAAEKLVGGFETTQFIEINPFCQKVLNKHWSHVPIHDDITTFTATPGEFDIITGGFPCQDISVAGLQKGITKETRSGLFYELIRVIRMVRPKYVVLENVAAILNRGLDIVLRELSEAGYDAEWSVIPASSVGACHQRNRWWLVAYPNDNGSPSAEKCGFNGEASDRTQERQNQSCQSERSSKPSNSGTIQSSTEFTNSYSKGMERRKFTINTKMQKTGFTWQSNTPHLSPKWRSYVSEPCLRRGDDGLRNRVDRLRSLGNSVVPQCAAIPLQRVKDLYATTS